MIFKELCNHHHYDLILEHFHHRSPQKRKPFIHFPHPPASFRQTLIYFLSQYSPNVDLSYKWYLLIAS